VAGLVAGAVVGVAFSLAVTPRSGKETRQQILGAAETATSAVISAPEALRDQVVGALQSQVNRFEEAVAAAREAAARTEQEMLEEYERTLEEARRAGQMVGPWAWATTQFGKGANGCLSR